MDESPVLIEIATTKLVELTKNLHNLIKPEWINHAYLTVNVSPTGIHFLTEKFQCDISGTKSALSASLSHTVMLWIFSGLQRTSHLDRYRNLETAFMK